MGQWIAVFYTIGQRTGVFYTIGHRADVFYTMDKITRKMKTQELYEHIRSLSQRSGSTYNIGIA